ncbi:MAG TPA: radical SAM protein [bacterium]|nr:radical SAM protein [bacterium]
MKILLIRPPFAVKKFYFPRFINESLGIESLAAFIEPFHEVKILDTVAEGWNKYWENDEYPTTVFQGLSLKKILKKIKNSQPDIIGISWLFSTQNESINLIIKLIRQLDTQVTIVVGGPHPSTDPGAILKENSEINLVVYGEGEITLKELMDNKCQNLEKIDGLAFRKNGSIIVNKPRNFIENLDTLPLPKRNYSSRNNYSKQNLYRAFYLRLKKMFNNEKIVLFLAEKMSSLPFLPFFYYYLHNRHGREKLPAAEVITSRGCPYHCTFCAIHNIWGHRWRMRSAESVLLEIDYLVKKCGAKHINFVDDNFNASKERVLKICQGIVKNNYNITFSSSSGSYVPTLDEEILEWLKKSGMSYIRMSIESGNSDILHNVIKKNIDLSKVKDIVAVCKKIGIFTEGAFIFGIPGETVKTMEESLSFAKEVNFDRVIRFIFQPFPHTELYDLCVKNNYLMPDYDPTLTYATGNKCYVKTEQLSPEEVQKIVGRSL